MVSLWKAISQQKQEYPPLDKNLEVDVLIIGGGITGITAAHQLISAGKTVAVIEAYEIGGVTTASSTGNLYVPVQPLYQSIEDKFGLEVVKNVACSRQIAIDYIEKISEEYGIACHFKKRPWYAYTNNPDNTAFLKELELFKKIELDVNLTDNLPLDLKFKKAMMMPDQVRFNPLEYVLGLAETLHKKGCQLFEHTRALKISEDSKCTVTTEHAVITAKNIIIATHTPIGINLRQMYIAPYRSYVVAVTLKNHDYPEGHYWDLDKPSHALCTQAISKSHPELLLLAGSHHKTGQDGNMKAHFKELSQFLKKQFVVDEIAYQWSAQHYHAADDIPYIGLAYPSAKHTYMATGYFADGLVYGTLAGIIIGDLVAEKKNEFFNIYNSNRSDFWHSFPFLLKENSNVLLHYLQDLPLFTGNQLQTLKKGEGSVIEKGRTKYAVSRDDNNELHIVSAVCPHMKGIVKWNNAEHTWDCPIHGSRFSPDGEVIEGPAICSLHKHTLEILDKDK